MKNAESVRKLLQAMNDFSIGYDCLRIEIENYERETGLSVNDLPGFTDCYPFDKSFDELAVDLWVSNTVDKIRESAFTVLNYEYLNTGGNTMVGIHEVWLPEAKRTVYAYTNEEGCTLSLVDYIRNELPIDDYDELVFDYIDWGRATGHEKYFELYRHCLNEYTKDDCKYFGYTRQLPIHLLSDALRMQINDDYKLWLEANEYDSVETDGKIIIVSPYYEIASGDERLLNAVKAFKHWHDSIAGLEEYYDKLYTLEFAGHKVELPFMADIWDAVDTMLERTIQDW